ncbi:hypothetical protein MAFF301524_03390 [Ralstonia pseudosolanacearum]|nr:hypothetical protein MAFF301524_03390 [Ralstonia pseudosolanacearum]
MDRSNPIPITTIDSRRRAPPGAAGKWGTSGVAAMRQSACGSRCECHGRRRRCGERSAPAAPTRVRYTHGAAAEHGPARGHGGAQNADFTTPPSTRSAAPVVADDSGLAT